jgi:rhodanese-related sulfurtransferase
VTGRTDAGFYDETPGGASDRRHRTPDRAPVCVTRPAAVNFPAGVREMGIKTLTPKQFGERVRGGEDLLLVDVREPEEYELARVEGARLLPLSLFNEWAPTLDPERPTVFICHHGIRSAQVCAYLSRQGFEKIYNLSGGIDRWSAEVDPSIPRY